MISVGARPCVDFVRERVGLVLRKCGSAPPAARMAAANDKLGLCGGDLIYCEIKISLISW